MSFRYERPFSYLSVLRVLSMLRCVREWHMLHFLHKERIPPPPLLDCIAWTKYLAQVSFGWQNGRKLASGQLLFPALGCGGHHSLMYMHHCTCYKTSSLSLSLERCVQEGLVVVFCFVSLSRKTPPILLPLPAHEWSHTHKTAMRFGSHESRLPLINSMEGTWCLSKPVALSPEKPGHYWTGICCRCINVFVMVNYMLFPMVTSCLR